MTCKQFYYLCISTSVPKLKGRFKFFSKSAEALQDSSFLVCAVFFPILQSISMVAPCPVVAFFFEKCVGRLSAGSSTRLPGLARITQTFEKLKSNACIR